ncbi:hypothetical protein Gocc_1374 [Gaiella occulta]|uniref:Uncharacterized protein n=1 Tax=Gaiella occulta TaxID=1002870 RepID=A0A7M2YZP8_9ACTN|nr:hypothetical protein [Gaiella occulta]RDI75576.1 hypothetical protein Gocc_1374 [Gaiella occulta]
MTSLVARGPDGGNLLGFLSALGALAVLDDAWTERRVRLSWTFAAVGWRPVLEAEGDLSEADIAQTILDACGGAARRPEFTELGDDLSVTHSAFRDVAARAANAATPDERRWADFIAAFGCELPKKEKEATIQDTALRTMSGAGHQHFLRSMRELANLATADDVRRALFEPWRYGDERPTMRWDPVDDRRYALRADDPAKSKSAPIRTVRGANRLAIEALPLLPTMPRCRRVETTGFQYGGSSVGRTIRWPIWEVPSSRATLVSLLASRDIVADPPDRDRLHAIGVAEVFASTRVTTGKIRSFTPAKALLGGTRCTL